MHVASTCLSWFCVIHVLCYLINYHCGIIVNHSCSNFGRMICWNVGVSVTVLWNVTSYGLVDREA